MTKLTLALIFFAALGTLTFLGSESHALRGARRSIEWDQAARYAKAPRYCDYILSTYLSAFGIPERLLEISRQLDDARDLKDKTHQPFTTLSDLAPLFDQGIIFHLLGDELRARGHRTIRSMEKTLRLMATTNSSKDQMELANGVVGRLLKEIGPLTVSFSDSDQMKLVERKAKKLGLSDPSTFAKLVQALKTQEKDDFIVIRLALLEILTENRGALSKNITSQLGSFTMPFKYLFRSDGWGWSYNPNRLDEATVNVEINKIVEQKIRFAETKEELHSQTFDHDFLSLLESIATQYCQWANLQTKTQWATKLITLSTKLQSDESFSRAIKIITEQILDGEHQSVFSAKLSELRDSYSALHSPRADSLSSKRGVE